MGKKNEQRETVYSSKSAAVKGMWTYYNNNIQCSVGNPLVGENGTVLQWCRGGHTEHMTVTTNDREETILIKSWLE